MTYCIRSWQKQEAEKVDEEEENEEKRKEELYLCSNLETPWQVWEKNMQHPVSLSSAQQFPKLLSSSCTAKATEVPESRSLRSHGLPSHKTPRFASSKPERTSDGSTLDGFKTLGGSQESNTKP